MTRRSEPWYREERQAWYVWHEGRQVRFAVDKKEAGLSQDGGSKGGQSVAHSRGEGRGGSPPMTMPYQRAYAAPLTANLSAPGTGPDLP